MYAAALAALAKGQTVVTANNRLSRTLRFHYDRMQQRAGALAWHTPDLCTWSHWLQRLWQGSRLRGGAARDRVLLADSAADWLWQQSIAAATPDRAALALRGLGKPSREAWRLANEWEALIAPEWTAAGLSPDQQAWLRWSGEFRQRCDAAGWVDSERLPALLTTDIRAGLFDALGPVCFAGFDRWPPARAALKSALAQRGIVTAELPAASFEACAAGSPCADASAELLAAARWARSRIAVNPDAAVGVIVPDLASRAGEVRRIFLDIFAPDWRSSGVPAGLPLNVSVGRPLADTPVIHTALLLLQLAATQVPFRDFSRLLRATWLRGAAAEYTQRGQLELELRRKVRQQFALSDALPWCRKYTPAFAATVAALLKAAEQSGTHSCKQWAELFSALLVAVGWPGDTALDSDAWQALRAWNELLADFAHSGQAQQAGIDRATALTWLLQLARERLFQPEGIADGVQVMGVLEAAGHGFDELWVCGMARELWPAPARPSAFVPLGLQRRLGMPDSTADAALKYAEEVLQRLIRSAPSVTLSWPLQQDGEPLQTSPLPEKILQAALNVAPAYEVWPLWNELALAHGPIERLELDPPPPLATGQVARGGATVLNLQAVSPLNAFIEKRLGATLVEPVPFGLDARERGNVIHGVLEAFYTQYPDRSRIAVLADAQRRAILAELLERALATLPGYSDAFIQTLVRLEHVVLLPRLADFVAVDLARPDFEVVACEARREVQLGPLRLSLKLDRLDQLADGQKFVIDYKTGRIDRQHWNPAWPRDLQLPLYVTTVVPDAAAIAFAQVASQGTGYDGVGVEELAISGVRSPGTRPQVEVKFQYPQSTDVIDSWEALRSTWAELLLDLAEQFAAGDFRLDPRNPASARDQFAVLSRVYDAGPALWEDEA